MQSRNADYKTSSPKAIPSPLNPLNLLNPLNPGPMRGPFLYNFTLISHKNLTKSAEGDIVKYSG